MTAIVLLHGYPLDASAFAGVPEHLDPGYRVIVPDLKGFGAASWPSDGDLTMEAQARHVFDAMDEAGVDSAVVVGLSMGGYVALAMLDLDPHRLDGLGLIGSKPEADTEAGRIGRDTQAETVVASGSSVLVEPMTNALLAPGAALMTRARLRTMIERTRIETYVSSLVGMRDRPDRTAVLGACECPVAILVGAHDPLVSVERGQEMASLCKDATLTVAPDAGHLVPMEDPTLVATWISDLVERITPR